MGLIDLKTNLKSLRYGDETPLVTKDINNPPSNNTFAMEVNHRVDDTVRIVKLIASKPGISWIAKQGALEVLQQRLKSDGEDKILKVLAAAGINTAKVIGSTLAQIPVNGTGTHFVRGFAGDKGYLGVSGVEFFGGSGIDKPSDPVKSILSQLDTRNSIYSPWGNLGAKINPADLPYPTSDEAIDQKIFESAQADDGFIDDIEFELLNQELDDLEKERNRIKALRKETRANLGDQGTRRNRIDYSNTSQDLADRINLLEPIFGSTDEDVTQDLIKFNFQIVTPQSDGGVKKNNLYFRAHLDSFSDSYTGNWSGHKYIGRAENFYTYSGFERGISLSFKIAAATRQEMKPLYQKIVTLASATAPTYEGAGFMKGTIVGLTVGDYLDRTYGVLNTVNYSWQTDYPWEIVLDKDKDADMQQLPMILDCNISFTPIQNFIPQTGQYHYITKEDGEFLNLLVNE